GPCAQIISDNAKTFIRASKDIQLLFYKAEKSSAITKFMAVHKISWKFNVALAPWWGGFFERLVGSVKFALRKTLGKSALTCDQLITVLCEAEATINSRPLTYVGDDTDPKPLTPAELFCGRSTISLPDVNLPSTSNQLSTRRDAVNRHKHIQELLK